MLDLERSSASPAETLGFTRDRAPQSAGARLPTGTVVVSADGHLPLTEDIFASRFPAHLKAKAPRIFFDEAAGLHQMEIDGQAILPEPVHEIVKSVEDCTGCQSLPARMAALDSEGVTKEIVFPQFMPFFFHWPDLEVRGALFTAYNDYVASLQAQQPQRFFPVAIPNYWDPQAAPASIRALAAQGLKTFMLPMTPGKMANGASVIYQDPEWDPMWSAAEETGLPVCFHIGERLIHEGLNGYAAHVLKILGPTEFRYNLGQLIFGRIFDRHPKLKVVFAEAALNWVPGALQDAEMIHDTHAKLTESRPARRPSAYWREHCYATFMWDPAGLALIDRIGADRVMWSVDYPHNESTFGYSHTAMQAVIDAVSADDARRILGGTAIEVFKL